MRCPCTDTFSSNPSERRGGALAVNAVSQFALLWEEVTHNQIKAWVIYYIYSNVFLPSAPRNHLKNKNIFFKWLHLFSSMQETHRTSTRWAAALRVVVWKVLQGYDCDSSLWINKNNKKHAVMDTKGVMETMNLFTMSDDVGRVIFSYRFSPLWPLETMQDVGLTLLTRTSDVSVMGLEMVKVQRGGSWTPRGSERTSAPPVCRWVCRDQLPVTRRRRLSA